GGLGLRPPRRQAVPAARGPLLRLPPLPPADLPELPGEPQGRCPGPVPGPAHRLRLRRLEAAAEPGRQGLVGGPEKQEQYGRVLLWLGYATVAGAAWCLLTDGDEYRFSNATVPVDAEEFSA